MYKETQVYFAVQDGPSLTDTDPCSESPQSLETQDQDGPSITEILPHSIAIQDVSLEIQDQDGPETHPHSLAIEDVFLTYQFLSFRKSI